VRGAYGKYIVELVGTSCQEKRGFPVSCPTDRGMAKIAMETFQGTLRVRLFEKSDGVTGGRMVMDATDPQACLEIGGLPWSETVWEGQSAMKEPIKSIATNIGEYPLRVRKYRVFELVYSQIASVNRLGRECFRFLASDIKFY
jgi:Tocopherol cyclase